MLSDARFGLPHIHLPLGGMHSNCCYYDAQKCACVLVEVD